MAITNIGTINSLCEPPVCVDTIEIRITNAENVGGIIFISWTIDGTSISPSQNAVLWSVGDKKFNNILTVQTSGPPFFVNFTPPTESGLLFFKVRILVGGTFFESDIGSINLSTEIITPPVDEFAALATLCSAAVDSNTSCPSSVANVWVKEAGIPRIPDPPNGIKPIYFRNNNNCYLIDDDNLVTLVNIKDLEGQIIKDTISLDFSSCFECLQDLSGPCNFLEDIQEGTSDFEKVYFINRTLCLNLTYDINGPANSNIIITNNKTGEILFKTGCITTAGIQSTEINILDLESIKVTVDAGCNLFQTESASWLYIIKCCTN